MYINFLLLFYLFFLLLRYERRSYGRDSFTSDMKREREERFNNEKRERDDNRRSGGRYRRYDKDEEPEW